MTNRHLPYSGVFLQPLDRCGIVEAITGPALSKRLKRHFGLTVEDGLAREIADDLLADPSSAVAPTLQILLSKLWGQAKARSYDHPTFDRLLYLDLRRQGLLLRDFLDQQLAMLRTVQPAAVDSGLALDLLAFHTTALGTAERRTLAETRETYAHLTLAIDALLPACHDLYLLVDLRENRRDSAPASRLAHDTLAPLVRQRFEESDAPGQRARRILESRLPSSKKGEPSPTDQVFAPLGDADLAAVVAGQDGMRTWKPKEQELVSISNADRSMQLEEQTRLANEREEAQQRALRDAQALADAEQKRAEEQVAAARRVQQRNRGPLVALVAALGAFALAAIFFFQAQQNAELANAQLENLRGEQLAQEARQLRSDLDATAAIGALAVELD